MDERAIVTLREAGVATEVGPLLPPILIGLDEKRNPVVITDEVPIYGPDETVVTVRLKPIAQLFSGSVVPPSFADGPTPAYTHFFMLIEQTAANFCVTTKRLERDAEFEAIYTHLRRRPDGKHANPLYSYLRAAVRLYMSLTPVSQAEFEAVVDRLRRSAKHFAINATTANYYHLLKNNFGLDDGRATPWPLSHMV